MLGSTAFWTQLPFINEAVSSCNKILAAGPLEPQTSTQLNAEQVRAIYQATVKQVETSAPALRVGNGNTDAHSQTAIDTHELHMLVCNILPEPQHALVITEMLVHIFEQRQDEREFPVTDYAGLASKPNPLAAPAAAPLHQRTALQIASSVAVSTADENIFAGKTPHQMATILLDKLDEPEQQRTVFTKWSEQLGADIIWQLYKETVDGDTGETVDGSRKRTLGGKFFKLARKAKNRAETHIVLQTTEAAKPLRAYQQRCVQRVQSERGNWIIVAPTGSGKTNIVVELAKLALEQQPQSFIVMLVPVLHLTSQQSAVFINSGFAARGWSVGCYNSEQSLDKHSWPVARHSHKVVVMTAQVLVNLLRYGAASMAEIDLLVLDECHHCTQQHPMNQVMQYYRQGSAAGDRVPQVVGLTASPAAAATAAATSSSVEQLRANMGGAQLLPVFEEDPEVAQVLATPSEHDVHVAARERDRWFRSQLLAFLLRELPLLDAELLGGSALAAVVGKAGRGAGFAVHEELLCNNQVSEVLKLLVAAGEKLQGGGGCGGLALVRRLLLAQVVRRAMELVDDTGFEGGAQYLAHKIASIGTYSGATTTVISTTQPSPQPPPDAEYKQSVQTLLQMTGLRTSELVSRCFPSGVLRADAYPKTRALLAFLQGFDAQRSVHGIVFTQTRQGCFFLGQQLRRCCSPFRVFELTGHGSSSNKAGHLHRSSERHVKGMSAAAQQAILHAFKAPGRHLLVATSAAEEGLDIPACEFVVRFSAAASGIVRTQSRGRARVRGSRYLSLVGGADVQLHKKARLEEEAMQQYLRGLAQGGA